VNVIREGDYVMLYLAKDSSKYLIKVKKGNILHTHEGFIRHEDLIGMSYGETILSSIGTEFFRL